VVGDPDRHGFAYRCPRSGFTGVIISGSQYFRLPSRIQTGGIMIQVPVWQPRGRNSQDVVNS
jgi:hypothetical protein